MKYTNNNKKISLFVHLIFLDAYYIYYYFLLNLFDKLSLIYISAFILNISIAINFVIGKKNIIIFNYLIVYDFVCLTWKTCFLFSFFKLLKETEDISIINLY